MSSRLAAAVWPADRLGELLEEITRFSQLRGAASSPMTPGPPASASPPAGDAASLGLFLDWACHHLGCEAEPASVAYDEVEEMLGKAAPAVLAASLTSDVDDVQRDSAGYLALVGSRLGRARLLSPSGATVEVPLSRLRSHLCREVEAGDEREIERLLDVVGIRGRRRREAHRALLGRRLGGTRLHGVWLLRDRSSRPFSGRLLRAGLGRRLAALVAGHALQTTLWIAAWWLVGKAFLAGSLPEGWLSAWLLLLATLIPVRLLVTWLQADLAIRAGALTKERLFAGGLKLDPDDVKERGVGELMGSVLESEAVEAQAIDGGFLALLGGVELLFALAILTLGAAGLLHPVLLAATVATTVTLAWTYGRQRRFWTDERLVMTHDLIEKMVGHRTRLVQESWKRRHLEEDRRLERYAATSRRLDARAIHLLSLVPRVWLLAALTALTPAFVAGTTPARLGVALGGILLAYRALGKAARGLTGLSDAALSWRKVQPLFAAAKREDPPGLQPPRRLALEPGATLLEARNLTYRYPGRTETVLAGCDVAIRNGERILVTGPSGTGKSTLLQILTGLRAGQEGLALLEGRDRTTSGHRAWRTLVGTLLQHHEQHLFSEPLLFNLAAGKSWPPSREELRRIEALCKEVGLEPLLERMPSRLHQTIGESGWRLSHGEKVRIGLARLLLGDPSLLLADESLDALDAEAQRLVLDACRSRAEALLVVRHA